MSRRKPENTVAQNAQINDFDTQVMGFESYQSGPCRRGYLVNFRQTTVIKDATEVSGVELYFMDFNGGRFRTTILYNPYLLLMCASNQQSMAEEFLRKQEGIRQLYKSIEWVDREDLKMTNHIIGAKRNMLKVSFSNVANMMTFRRFMFSAVKETEHILDIREADVPYHVRVFIDLDIRVGKWYKVWNSHGSISLKELSGSGYVVIDDDEVEYDPEIHSKDDICDWEIPAMPQVMAFDIEAAKRELMFPDAESPDDEITMISYMINDSQGYLITNRSYVSEDIESFEFNPKPEYPGPFEVFNEPDEKHLLQRWFDHVREIKPMVMVTFNGDFFDWPYIAKRAERYGMDITDIIGFLKIEDADDYWSSPSCCHLDVFSWVKRDSYLPQGSQGLKSVTFAKLKFRPLELDPEEMTPFASEKPQVLAEYSVSDAVATYYLYHKFVHPFIFSLCKILPLTPDEVLRKGTGTLCEMLLMVQAYKNQILLPHKHKEAAMKYYNGHLIESETYSGGHVECLHAGVFRNDLDYKFDLRPATIQGLIDELRDSLLYTIRADMGIQIDDRTVSDFDVMKSKIENDLKKLRDNPHIYTKPYIYHLDVASMYPNIMTTNRLQPDSMTTEENCRKCHYYAKDRDCARRLEWQWRVDYYGADAGDKRMLERMLYEQKFKVRRFDQVHQKWETQEVYYDDLPQERREQELRDKIISYSKEVKRHKHVEEVVKEAIVCQRENPFYIDTVQSFKNRRIDYKRQSKKYESEARAESNPLQKDLLLKKHITADSMQLAHKVILNSFYGYVKRKGSRWYSDEMAGVTCYTGAKIIQEAREIVDGIGISLELDTDGIWCMLPSAFPTIESFTIRGRMCENCTPETFENCPDCEKKVRKVKVEYPGAILNYMVWKGYTNYQYQTLRPEKRDYDISVRNSIFFEVDGPYKAMILPTSKEKGVNLKKRYAVFHLNGSLAELKGFELKRRGELEMIKSFQADLFAKFLEGETLEESYAAAAAHADSWLKILHSRGVGYQQDELLKLISEEKSLSKPLHEYGAQKSNQITAVKRIVSMLGETMAQSKSLKARYVISRYPRGAANTERAFPTLVFGVSDENERAYFLRQWAKEPTLNSFDLSDLVDWDYYTSRLEDQILKIIVIPAHMQKIANPLPKVKPPGWALEELKKTRQITLGEVFKKASKKDWQDTVSFPTPETDIEDFGKKRKEPMESEEFNLQGTPPDIDVDYGAWLDFQKHIWAQQAKQRETKRKLFGKAVSRVKRGFSKFVFNPDPSVQWIILQLKPYGFKVKAQVWDGKGIYPIIIEVPRKVFVRFKSEPPTKLVEDAQKSSFDPPDAPAEFLYEFTFDEETWQQKTPDIINDPLVECVYESKLEPTERALIELGSQVVYKREFLESYREGQANGFKLDWIAPIPGNSTPVPFPHLNFIQIQHYELYGQKFVFIAKSWTEDADLFHYVAEGNANTATLPLEPLYRRLRSDDLEQKYFVFPEHLRVSYHRAKDQVKFFKKIDSELEQLHSSHSSSSILVLESPNVFTFQQNVRTASSFVYIEQTPSLYAFDPLSFSGELAKQMVKQFLRMQDNFNLDSTIPISEFSRVPVANFPRNNLKAVIDIAYARKLHAQRSILWWSESVSPDSGSRDTMVETVLPREINRPGFQSQICVDFEIKNFELNALLVSNYQASIDNTTTPFVSDSFNLFALQGLYDLIRGWTREARNQTWQAEDLIRQFYAWVSSSSSRLYNPRLFYFVENLANGIFTKMINVLEAAELTVVHATRSRLIVGTGKYFERNAFDADSAIQDIIHKSEEYSVLFTYLEIYVDVKWNFLAWYNKDNYTGQTLKAGLDDEVIGGVEDFLVTKWRIRDYLPNIFHQEFEWWYQQFATYIALQKQKLNPLELESTEVQKHGPNYFISGMIPEIREALIQKVKQLNRKYTESLADPSNTTFQFPSVAGLSPEFSPKNPVLEFIKTILLFLSLDVNIEKEYLGLRNALLKILNVGSFEPQAQWTYPFTSLIVRHVLCQGPGCSNVVDIDVCRIPQGKTEEWCCSTCGNRFDTIYLEERLIQMLMQHVQVYQQQDLKCEKCHGIRKDDMSLYCRCSGRWIPTLPRSDLIKSIEVYEKVANFHDMKYLLGLVQSIH